MRLNILSGGAAQSVVTALAGDFRAATGYELACTFSAVGAMKAKLLSGAPADLVILTQALVAELAAGGQVLPDSRADLGRVRTGVAVRAGDPLPDIASAAPCAAPCSLQKAFSPRSGKSDRRHPFCRRAGQPRHPRRSRAAL